MSADTEHGLYLIPLPVRWLIVDQAFLARVLKMFPAESFLPSLTALRIKYVHPHLALFFFPIFLGIIKVRERSFIVSLPTRNIVGTPASWDKLFGGR